MEAKSPVWLNIASWDEAFKEVPKCRLLDETITSMVGSKKEKLPERGGKANFNLFFTLSGKSKTRDRQQA